MRDLDPLPCRGQPRYEDRAPLERPSVLARAFAPGWRILTCFVLLNVVLCVLKASGAVAWTWGLTLAPLSAVLTLAVGGGFLYWLLE